MEQYVLVATTIILTILFIVFLVIGIVNHIIEPSYMMIYKKPLLVHLYVRLKKLTPSQHRILEGEFKFYRRLTPKRRRFFEHRVACFIAGYSFIGKSSLSITDEMRVMIAGTYVMLTFGMRYYRTNVFDKILIYPDVYYSTINKELHHGEFNPLYKAIVFSWKHFKEGHRVDNNNINLGIHEFAHALHYHGSKKRDNSAAMFSDGYENILKEVKHPANAKRLVESEYFRIYAYTNEFEFLAVILEHFFETPHIFRGEFPELFRNVQLMINHNDV